MSAIMDKPPSQKQPRVQMPKLRKAARGAECMMHIDGVCNHDPETTVLAHSRSADRGMGRKPDDWDAVNMCSACHDEYDQRTNVMKLDEWDRSDLFHYAWSRQVRWWLENGLLS